MITFIKAHHRPVILLFITGVIIIGVIFYRRPISPAPDAGPSQDRSETSDATRLKPPSPPSTDTLAATYTSPTPAACDDIDVQVAKAVLGGDPHVIQEQTNILSADADMHASQCTFSSGGDTLRLTSYVATSPLGQSANAVAFGSGRPTGAQNEPSYGQAAYWDPALQTLSILKENNRYDIVRTVGSQSAGLDKTKAAADHIVPKL